MHQRLRPHVLVGAALALGLCAAPNSAVAAPTQPGEIVNEIHPPSACEFCHQFPNASDNSALPPYAPLRSWQGSMMANSARDPVFWAGLAVAAQDIPEETELCVRCHAPKAFLDGVGAVSSIEQLEPAQQQGVECEFCHRMMDDGVTPAGNAQYTLDDVIVGTEVPRRGPWNFTDGNPEPPHAWIQDPFIGSSRFCGTCHDVTTPIERVDDAGVGMGRDFNEQRTYSEWLNSDYADDGEDPQSCQHCHMPEVTDMAACTEHQNQYSHATGGRRHDLVGANRFMVEMLKQEYGSAGSNLIADIYFNFTLEQMDAFLPSSASLTLDAPVSVDLTQGLSGIDVVVTNESGHKLPSGYSEGRVMWIELVARYQGQVVYSSGLWDQETGIEQDAQLRTYEAIGEELATGTTFHLLKNDHWAVDNRIPPKGLKPDIETDPVGDRYELTMEGTWPNFDTHSYTFAAAPELYDLTPEDNTDDQLELELTLRYLINTPEYIEFLGDNGGNAGIDVAALFEAAGGATPVTLAQQSVSIPITAFGSDPPVSDETESSGESVTSGSATSEESSSEESASEAVGTTAPANDDDGGGGCACSSDPDRRWPLGTLLLLPFVGMRRRRSA